MWASHSIGRRTIALWTPTRRELIRSVPLVLGAAALPGPLRAAVGKPNLRIIVLGDWGKAGNQYQRHVAAWMDHQARNSGCDLIVTTGDNFYKFGVASAQDPKWRASYETVYSPELRRIPWFPVAGNHDWGGSIWAQLDRTGTDGWHMPWLWHDIPGSRFGRPDVHLFFIDTTVWKGKENKLYRMCGQAIRPEDIDRQKAWLADALRASCAPTKLVFGHHPIYTAEKDGTGIGVNDLDPMLVEAKVTAYVNGHDHSLYHIRGQGMDYICSGGGAEERPRRIAGRVDPGCVVLRQCETPRVTRYLARAGFATLDIGPDAVTLRFVDREGRVTPPEIIRSRGNHALGCGPLPVDPAVLREQARARAKTFLPCASLL